MKMVKGGRRVLMGQIATGTYNGSENRIQLFDGLFTTGYRVSSLKIAPEFPTDTGEYVFKIATEPKSAISEFNWQDVQELAWATWNVPTDSRFGVYVNIRDDNMAIEDLYISAYTTAGSTKQLNYEIVLEKFEFPAWTGAGVLVENLSQAGPE